MDAKVEGTPVLARNLEAEGVKFMFASYVDLHGVPKGKVVPIAHLDRMLSGSGAVHGRSTGWRPAGRQR